MIEKITELEKNRMWAGETAREILCNKINELVDAVNRHENIIRQIGEWGSSKNECLWCENLTEVNLNDRMIGCTTLDIPESYKELHKAPETELERTRKALAVAKRWLMNIGHLNMSDHGLGSEKMMVDWCKSVALHGLEEVETALEQKE